MSQLSQLLKNHQDKNGISLFEHLNQFLFDISQQKDSKYASQLECFELLSDFFKKNRFIYSQPKSDVEVNAQKQVTQAFSEWSKAVTELLATVGRNNQSIPCILQNFVNDARALEYAGIGFGEERSYRIQLSIKRLAIETNAKEMYFWGRILTTNGDYWVAIGITPPLPTDKLPENGEPRGVGLNYYTYWVTHDILEDWYELPLVTPEQMVIARQIKHICTGDLDATLSTYPVFPGKERHYLKAQLVRITYANYIVPKGMYKPNEENAKEVEFEEEFKMPEFADFSNLENWVHLPPQVLKLGRVTHWFDPQLTEEGKQAKQDELNENDPEIDRLRGINEDRPFEPYETNWLVKTVGDVQQFNPYKEDSSIGVYGVTVLRNYTWPGAITVAYVIIKQRTGFGSFYVGYGLKISQPTYLPISPNDLLEEPDDIEEHYEPNPKNLPPVKQIGQDEGQENQEGLEQEDQ